MPLIFFLFASFRSNKIHLLFRFAAYNKLWLLLLNETAIFKVNSLICKYIFADAYFFFFQRELLYDLCYMTPSFEPNAFSVFSRTTILTFNPFDSIKTVRLSKLMQGPQYLHFQNSELIESTERNEEIIKPISLKPDEKQFEIESLSSETATDKQSEWYDIEIETNNRDTDNNHQSNTFYAVAANENNDDRDEETLMVPVDLSNDIAINQMLADQGAIHNPDAEVFDIHQFGMKVHEDLKFSPPENEETKQDSFDYYLPYHHHHDHHTAEQPHSIK